MREIGCVLNSPDVQFVLCAYLLRQRESQKAGWLMIVICVDHICLDMCCWFLVNVWVCFFVVTILDGVGDVAVRHCKQGYVDR